VLCSNKYSGIQEKVFILKGRDIMEKFLSALSRILKNMYIIVKEEWNVFLSVSFGTFLIAAAVIMFVIPNRFPDIGVTGLAVLSSYIWGISPVWVIVITNALLLAWGWKVLSRRFVIWSLFTVVLFTVLLGILETMPVPNIDDRFMAAVIAGVLKGLGAGLIYSHGVSTGGTDIPGMVLRKRRGVEMGTFNIYINFVILCFSFFVVGLESAIYGLVSVYVFGIVADNTQRSFDRRKQVMIITNYPMEVSKFLIYKLNRGVTEIEGRGGYSRQKRPILIALLGPMQTASLKNYLSEIDPSAFMSVSDASEVLGNGFKTWKSL